MKKTQKKKTIKINKLKLKSLKIKDLIDVKGKGDMDYKDGYLHILKSLEFYNKVHEKNAIKAKKYREAHDKIAVLSKVESVADIKDLAGVGKAMTDKLDEFIKTGKVMNLEKLKEQYGVEKLEEEQKNTNIKDVFTNIYGIGDKKAEELILKGINTLDKLIERQNEKQDNKLPLLNEKQQIGLKYYTELLERIPRSEIEEYKKVFTKLFDETSAELNIIDAEFEIVGSYRRGKETSGDIDVIITSKSGNKTIFTKFMDKLIKNKILIELLSRGPVKSLTIGRLNENSKARRLDFLYTPPEEYAFAILYFTGSMEFNTAMRQLALDNNLTLNEHGFHTMINRKKGEKVESTKFETEKDIFDYLNMVYKEPNERIDGNSVVLKNAIDETPELPKKETPELPKKESGKNVKKTVKAKEKKNETLKTPNNISDVNKNFEKFKSEGIDALKTMSSDELNDMLVEAINLYYGSEKNPIVSDIEYDILREYILEKYPDNEVAKDHQKAIKVETNKVKLPYEMWSMDKIKPDTKELGKFKDKYKGLYVLSTKLDGVSGLYSTEKAKPELYTRGNGVEGQLISHLIPYFKLPKDKDITIRGEIIIKKEVFDKKYSDKFANSRNFVSGITNRKKLSKDDIEVVKDVDFVAYEVIKPENLKPSEQFKLLETLNVITAKNMINVSPDKLTNEYLSEKLVDWRSNYDYLIDGVICSDDNVYPRSDGNPDHAFAFKMVLSDQVVESKVLDIIWTPSKDGFLKPRVRIEPVTIGGVIVTYVTGINAKFVCDNMIGLGAIVKLVRSGDVIPKIVEVIEPADQPLMPTDKYVWGETKVDIMLENIDDETVVMKNILAFFKTLEVAGIGEGNVKKIMKAEGNSIAKILAFTVDDFKKVDGFGDKTANKIYEGIKKAIETTSIAQIAAASNVFPRGIGTQKIQLVLNSDMDVLDPKIADKDKLKHINGLPGFAKKTSESFMQGIPKFIEFIKEAKLEYKLEKEIKSSKSSEEEEETNVLDNPIKGKKIVLSDIKGKKDIKERIIALGGIAEDTVNKNIDILVMGSLDNETTKMKQAKKYNIMIMSLDDFQKML